MTVRQALARAIRQLQLAGFRSPREDARVLLCLALGWTRSELLARPSETLPPDKQRIFERLLERRLSHEPLQYLRGEQEFYGRPFRVTTEVLVPRPETELLVEIALDRLQTPLGESCRVLDVGTGSGCIAVTLLAERPALQAVATDISAAALEIAAANAAALDCAERLTLVQSCLFESLPPGRFDLIVSNPPYVGRREVDRVDLSVRRWEPPEAVFAGEDGLAVIEGLLAAAAGFLAVDGVLILEFGEGQLPQLRRRARAHDWQLAEVRDDLAGIQRCAVLSRAAAGQATADSTTAER